MGLGRYIAKRIFYNVLVLEVVATLQFFLVEAMPGGPTAALILNPNLTEEDRAAVARLYGLDKSPIERFFIYIWNLNTFQFGMSFYERTSVYNILLGVRMYNTILLFGTATILTIIIGIVLGVYAAARHGTPQEQGSMLVAIIMYTIPLFWLGLLLLYLFAKELRWFPMGGTRSIPGQETGLLRTLVRQFGRDHFITQFVDISWHLVLPVLTLILVSYGGWAIITKNAMLDIVSQDYILTARAKGLDEKRVYLVHALRNAMLPLITLILSAIPGIISGGVITETVFNWYGIGRKFFDAVVRQDYPIMFAAFWVLSILTVFANLIADILYAYFDPRVKY